MKNFSFIKNQKIFFGITIVVVILGIVSFFVRGFNLDIDFIGGTEISYNMGQTITKDDEAVIAEDVKAIIGSENFSSLRVSGDKDVITVRTLVMDNTDNTDEISSAIDAKMAELYPNAVLSADSTDTDKIYTLPDADPEDDEPPAWSEEDSAAVQEALAALEPAADGLTVNAADANLYVSFTSSSIVAKYRSDITAAITEKYENESWRSTDTVSAEVSAGLKSSAILATVVAVILMLIYIAFRFQISSAFAAIVCLVHDIFVMIAAYSLFQLPVNSTIIAALLTILGYSINATIIIFDRIRENDKKLGHNVPFADKVDGGIRATLWRSVNTTITTLLTIGMIYILGVTSIKNFALPLIVGIVSGLYSSVCLAGPLWNAFKKVGAKIRK
ncbi:MAG: protein translocase subunit SecF [Eubacteriales bacterium]